MKPVLQMEKQCSTNQTHAEVAGFNERRCWLKDAFIISAKVLNSSTTQSNQSKSGIHHPYPTGRSCKFLKNPCDVTIDWGKEWRHNKWLITLLARLASGLMTDAVSSIEMNEWIKITNKLNQSMNKSINQSINQSKITQSINAQLGTRLPALEACLIGCLVYAMCMYFLSSSVHCAFSSTDLQKNW